MFSRKKGIVCLLIGAVCLAVFVFAMFLKPLNDCAKIYQIFLSCLSALGVIISVYVGWDIITAKSDSIK